MRGHCRRHMAWQLAQVLWWCVINLNLAARQIQCADDGTCMMSNLQCLNSELRLLAIRFLYEDLPITKLVPTT
jgi:hypothetical protein